jgi:hypothetical protein
MHPIDKIFLYGVLLGPLFWMLLYMIGLLLLRRFVSFSAWFKGLPIIQWPAMYLIVLGSSMVTRKYCQVMRYENRLWYSPIVTRFTLTEERSNDAKRK